MPSLAKEMHLPGSVDLVRIAGPLPLKDASGLCLRVSVISHELNKNTSPHTRCCKYDP